MDSRARVWKGLLFGVSLAVSCQSLPVGLQARSPQVEWRPLGLLGDAQQLQLAYGIVNSSARSL